MQRRFLFLLLLFAPFAHAAIAQTRPQALASGSIVGRVVAADTGAPLRGVQVRVRSATGGDVRLVTTDEQGVFEARNLFAGNWLVAASKSGFITTRYGSRRSSDEGRPIGVSDRQRAQVSIALQRAGVITGHVSDEFGEPLLGARIQAMRSRVVGGRRQLAPVGVTDSTDDTGAFRLFGLAPGTYYVTAMLRGSAPDASIMLNTVGTMTYYAGTADVGEAQPIALRAGDEMNIAFQVAPARSVQISGTVFGANGSPSADTEVRLQRLDATDVGTTVGNFGRSGPDGSFTIINVPPGSYVLSANRLPSMNGTLTRADIDRVEQAAVPLTVGLDDIPGITLAMGTSRTLQGTIVADNSSTLPSPLRLEITATPVDGLFVGGGPIAIQVTRTAGRPLTFEMPRLFGGMAIGVNLPDGLMLNAIEVNGMDMTDKPIDVRSGSSDVRIVLSSRVTEVSGLVTRSASPVRDGSVIVFPDDPSKWTFPSRYIAYADIDAEGRFAIRRLPAGQRYFAAVVPTLDDGDQYDADLLSSLRDRATSFTLRDGERKALSLDAGR